MVIQELIDKNLLVSIITPAYQSEKYIKHTIDAIIKQTYTNWELLITDDNSSDNTVNIINQYITIDKRIKLFKLNKNYGAAIARNNSIKNSNGRFIAFCDSDDLWMHDKLEKQLSFILNNNFSFIYSAYQKIDISNKLGSIINVPVLITYNDLLKTCNIGCLTVMYDTKKIGLNYFPNIRIRQDYALWLTILNNNQVANGLNEVLAYYRTRNSSISGNKFKSAIFQFRVLRNIANLSFFKATYFFLFYIFHGFKKFIK
jgi:glycosyltransferase involved in cell wall biosynthesis